MTEAQARRIALAIFEALGERVTTVRIYPSSGDGTVRVVVYQLLNFSGETPPPFTFTRADLAV